MTRWWVLLYVSGDDVLPSRAGLPTATPSRRHLRALIAEQAGPGHRDTVARERVRVAWRLDRGALLCGRSGLCLYGLLIGGVIAQGIGGGLDDYAARDIVVAGGATSWSRPSSRPRSHAGHDGGPVPVADAAAAQEEAGRRAETLLSGSVAEAVR